MKIKIEEAIDAFLVTDFYPEYVRIPLAKALSKLPDDVIGFVAAKCIFVVQEMPHALSPGQQSFYLSFRDPRLKNKSGIIFLNSFLFRSQPRDIAFTVAHEVAHCRYDDIPPSITNPSLPDKDRLKLNLENEVRADKLAIKWLSKHYKESALMKRRSYWKKLRESRDHEKVN